MEDLLIKLPHYLELLAQVLGALVVVATAVARVTPSKSDNIKVQKVSDKVLKVVSYLPTLGINPKTAQFKKAYEELKK